MAFLCSIEDDGHGDPAAKKAAQQAIKPKIASDKTPAKKKNPSHSFAHEPEMTMANDLNLGPEDTAHDRAHQAGLRVALRAARRKAQRAIWQAHPSPEKDQHTEVPPSPAKGGEGGVTDMSLSDADSDDDLPPMHPAQRTGCQFRHNWCPADCWHSMTQTQSLKTLVFLPLFWMHTPRRSSSLCTSSTRSTDTGHSSTDTGLPSQAASAVPSLCAGNHQKQT